jgi:hypothetical protein
MHRGWARGVTDSEISKDYEQHGAVRRNRVGEYFNDVHCSSEVPGDGGREKALLSRKAFS